MGRRPLRSSRAVDDREHVDLRRRWIAAFVLGELVGFVPPALTGAGLANAGVTDPVLVSGLVVAGAAEGAILGFAQGRVLTAALPGPITSRWVVATALGAAVAWLAGMGGSALIQAWGVSVVPLVVPGFVIGLCAMGFLQWCVLRPHLSRCLVWVPVTAGSWLVGVLIPVAALSLVPNSWPLLSHVSVGVAAAVAMGATVGAISGGTLDRLLARAAQDLQVPVRA